MIRPKSAQWSWHPGRLARRWKQAVPGQERDHELVEQPGLLDLAGMSSPRQHLHLAVGNARLQRERALMRAVLAAAENDRRAGDAVMVILGIALRVRLELMDDRLQV